jgi:hypothetical protein
MVAGTHLNVTLYVQCLYCYFVPRLVPVWPLAMGLTDHSSLYSSHFPTRTIIYNSGHSLVLIAVTLPASNEESSLTFWHRASCILGQAFHYSPENAFYIFNQQIYFII